MPTILATKEMQVKMMRYWSTLIRMETTINKQIWQFHPWSGQPVGTMQSRLKNQWQIEIAQWPLSIFLETLNALSLLVFDVEENE